MIVADRDFVGGFDADYAEIRLASSPVNLRGVPDIGSHRSRFGSRLGAIAAVLDVRTNVPIKIGYSRLPVSGVHECIFPWNG